MYNTATQTTRGTVPAVSDKYELSCNNPRLREDVRIPDDALFGRGIGQGGERVEKPLAGVYIEITCHYCATLFMTVNLKARFCCRDCRVGFFQKPESTAKEQTDIPVTKPCIICGKTFKIRNLISMYCSTACRNTRKARLRAEAKASR